VEPQIRVAFSSKAGTIVSAIWETQPPERIADSDYQEYSGGYHSRF